MGLLIMPALTLAINLSFLLLLKLNQSNMQFQQRIKKSPTIMGWIYIDNTRLWQFRFKVSSMLETVSPSIFHEVMGLHAMILVSEC